MNITYNYDDDIDFYKEINDEHDIDNNDSVFLMDLSSNDLCLLSKTKLQPNYIKLSCGHKFNYVALINEMYHYKHANQNYYNNIKQNNLYNTLCPYCRKYTLGVLPYIPSLYKNKIKYVNTPVNMRFINHKCNYNNYINNSCNENGIETPNGTYCSKHIKNINKYNNYIVNDNWNDEMIFFLVSNKVNIIKELLKEKGLILKGNKKKLVERYFHFKA